MYDDANEDISQRIDESLAFVEAFLDKDRYSDTVENLKKKQRPIPWEPDFDWREWHRKFVEWNFAKRLSSLARAKQRGRMDEDQQSRLNTLARKELGSERT